MRKIVLATGTIAALAGLGLGLTSCERATVDVAGGYGPNPALPSPNPKLIPTVNIAAASSWPDGTTPVAAEGLTVNALADGLDHPRWLHVLPNGDVLVAETNAPAKPDAPFSLRGWIMGLIMARAGAAVPRPTGSLFCAMPMATVARNFERLFWKACILLSA